jgi:hypothetical protein
VACLKFGSIHWNTNIVEICKDPTGEEARSSQVVEGLNLRKVERILDDIDYE